MRFRHGRLGVACAELGFWVFEGVVGGFHDGLDAVAQSRNDSSRAVVLAGDSACSTQ